MALFFVAKEAALLAEIIRFLALLHACLSADEMHGAVEFA